jgi:hypothetical protein
MDRPQASGPSRKTMELNATSLAHYVKVHIASILHQLQKLKTATGLWFWRTTPHPHESRSNTYYLMGGTGMAYGWAAFSISSTRTVVIYMYQATAAHVRVGHIT